MKIRTIERHFRDAFKSLFRNGMLTFRAISAVSITLTLVGFLTAILFNVNKITMDIEQDVNIRVHIDLAADTTKEQELQATIEAIPEVQSVNYRTKDEVLEEMTKSYSEKFQLFKNDKNPLYNVLEVKTNTADETKAVAAQIEGMDYVAEVSYGGTNADKLFNIIGMVRNVGIVIVVVLLISAVFLISNTIRSTIEARRTEIEIMKLVGAKNSYIRWPFFLEGAIIGVVGSLLPVGLLVTVYFIAYERLSARLAVTHWSLLDPNPFLMYLVAGMFMVGIFIGAFGAQSSVRRFLKI